MPLAKHSFSNLALVLVIFSLSCLNLYNSHSNTTAELDVVNTDDEDEAPSLVDAGLLLDAPVDDEVVGDVVSFLRVSICASNFLM